jgi:hypothetical protein
MGGPGLKLYSIIVIHYIKYRQAFSTAVIESRFGRGAAGGRLSGDRL